MGYGKIILYADCLEIAFLKGFIMRLIESRQFDKERELYGEQDLEVVNCSFQGRRDGESALKECKNIRVANSLFDLRYPCWHVDHLEIEASEMTENCRAPIWYSNDVTIKHGKIQGIKAIRECDRVYITNSQIKSPEFGWKTRDIEIEKGSLESEYCLFQSENVRLRNLYFEGKYAFQYAKDVFIENSDLNTKDAFWHAENCTVQYTTIRGEYLGWYSKNLTIKHCTIIGTQPFCYCENLVLEDCKMIDTDLAFEKSTVNAEVTTKILSVKNIKGGIVKAPGVIQIIQDDENAKGEVVIDESLLKE